MSLAERAPAHAHDRAPRPGAPQDNAFERWASQGLVWLPERGMGKLHVRQAPYDAGYFEKYVGYAETQMGRAITAARVELVNRFTDGHVVDVGIGCGDFITARGGFTYGYDVNPAGVEWLHRHGRFLDPYALQDGVQGVTLWDVLEHIPQAQELLARVRRWVFVSIPIVPGDGPPPLDWKHLRRDEHCWYFTRAGFEGWMDAHGWELREATQMESDLGREDIGTFVFKRRGVL